MKVIILVSSFVSFDFTSEPLFLSFGKALCSVPEYLVLRSVVGNMFPLSSPAPNHFGTVSTPPTAEIFALIQNPELGQVLSF